VRIGKNGALTSPRDGVGFYMVQRIRAKEKELLGGASRKKDKKILNQLEKRQMFISRTKEERLLCQLK